MLRPGDSLDLARLGLRLRAGDLRPSEIVAGVLERIARRGDDKVWIHLLSRDQLMDRAADLERKGSSGLPLYGLPFAIKDNIDLANHPTTAACPDFAYTPPASAPVVQALLDACANAFDPKYLSGGSSSGSAIAVACSLVSFALGTDTAGSGRVPAAFNNLIGLKPTRGLLSTAGVVPACRTLDCVSVLASSCDVAHMVWRAARGFDSGDPFSREPHPGEDAAPWWNAPFRFGVPRSEHLEFFGDEEAKALYAEAVRKIEQLGGERFEIDFSVFRNAANLLYEGPWVAERLAAIQSFLRNHSDEMNPVVRGIISGGERFSAVDVY